MSEALCKGSWLLGSACGTCARCRESAPEVLRSLLDQEKHRILRRLERRTAYHDAAGEETHLGIMLDVETTGLAETDEIIELAMVPFTFTSSGKIVEVREPFNKLRQPKNQIPPAITKITGITDEMVEGKTIAEEEVDAFVEPAQLIIAHHAGFDRPFCEDARPIFKKKRWGCSMSQIDWHAEGFDGHGLGYLATQAGFFYDKHRALDDCYAAIELMAQRSRGDRPLFAQLLDAVRAPDIRVWAIGSAFETKDTLKARGYRWSDGANGKPKSWFIDKKEAELGAEVSWLETEIYRRSGVNLRTDRITALDRFSRDRP
jgi:DNA polymerase-3 subunit epsilon